MRCLAALLALASTATAQIADFSTRLDDLVRQEMADNDIKAVSVAVLDHGRILYSKDFGTAAGSIYRVGSVSKLFTDIAIMQMVERGQLDLDAPVTRYLRDFKHPVTLRQLMSHRAGLVREPPVGHYFDATSPTLSRTVLSVNDTELVYAPGERTKYSNAGIAVAGYILERTQKQPFADYVKAKVLDPLGMKESAFVERPAVKAWMWTLDGRSFEAPTFQLGMTPAGGMYSTTADLLRFAAALFKQGAPVLQPATLEQMWTPQFQSAYGLGFRLAKLEGHRLVGHGGAIYGFATELEVLPDEQLAAIAIATKDSANPVVTQIANQALRWSLGITSPAPLGNMPKAPPEPLEKPSPVPGAWRPLIGEYGWDFDTLYIHERAGKLTSLIEWFSFDALTPVAPNVFRFPDSGLYAGEKATFLRDAKGQVRGVRIGGVLFPKRPDPAEPGATFRLHPVRPPAELLRTALASSPPEQPADLRAPDLVELVKLDPTIKLDIRYATTNNFMSTPFYTEARAFLQRPAADAMLRVQRKLGAQGFGLLIHDAYRPWYVTKMFWDGTPPDKHNFVADPSHGSRHNRGCAVDLTLFDLGSGKPIEMTGGYDEMSTRSYPHYQGGTSLQRWHRELLRRSMEAEGFQVYEYEWWHFDYQDWQKYPVLNKRFESL